MADNDTYGNNFKRFLKENKTLTISVPILIVLIVVVIVIYSAMGGENVDNVVPALIENAPAEMTGNPVEVLPQTERETGLEGANQSDIATDESGQAKGADSSMKNPFSGPIKLTGILLGDDSSMAVLEFGGKTLIVEEDETLDNGLIVGSISYDKVILKDNDKDIELYLD